MLFKAWLGPIIETWGLIFSRIHVTQSTGEPPKPLGFLADDQSKSSKVKSFK
jgi:hypothetical protein